MRLIIATLLGIFVSGLASAQSAGPTEESESTPFWFKSVSTGKVRQTTIRNAKKIQASRSRSSLPSNAQTVVPENLRGLALDFAVLLDGGGKFCSNYQFQEVRAPVAGGNPEEIWAIDACGTPLAVKVTKGSCGNLLGSEYVSVTAAYAKTATLYGNIPLIVDGAFTFLPACENIN